MVRRIVWVSAIFGLATNFWSNAGFAEGAMAIWPADNKRASYFNPDDKAQLEAQTSQAGQHAQPPSYDPDSGTAYFNLCVKQFNTGNVDAALDACEKAIAADPNRADAYFIKGSLLIGRSKTDQRGKIIAPTGAAESLKRYLELAPDGAHANEVRQMLGFIGSKLETTH